MNRTFLKTLILALPVFFLSSQATADIGVSIDFSSGEISIIQNWYREHRTTSGRGHGKGKPKGLPPGIAKNLARGKPLPPGIAKQYLPAGLQSVLPRLPDGFERIIVDGKVLIVEIATHLIHDVLMDAIL